MDEQDRLRRAKLEELGRDVQKGLDCGKSDSRNTAVVSAKARAFRSCESLRYKFEH